MLRRAFLSYLFATPAIGAEYFGAAPFEASLSVIMEPAQKPVKKRYYNIYRTKSNWTYPGKRKGDLINHLMHGFLHRSKFDRDKLQQLSYSELLKLHSNDHEGVPFFWSTTSQPAIKQGSKPKKAAADCPT